MRTNVQVPLGTALLRIAPSSDAVAGSASGDVPEALAQLPAATVSDQPEPTVAPNLDELRCLFLGYDVGPGHLRWLMAARAALRRRVRLADGAMRRGEDELLGIFVDLLALFDRQPDEEELEAGVRLSPRRAFLTYLRDPSSQGEDLPAGFVDKLRRALTHYGVDDLERTPQLDAALYRIHRAHQRLGELVAPVLDILERRLEVADSIGLGEVDDEFRLLLDRLIAESRAHLPAIHDSAREVRYRYVTEPVWQKAREKVYRRAERELEELAGGLEGEPRAARIDSLVECPQPLKSLLSRRFATARPRQRCTMLEVMLRRYYRIRQLENVRCFRLDEGVGRAFAAADYSHEGRRIHVLVTHGDYARLEAAFGDIAHVLAEVPDAEDVVIDIYAWRDSPLGPVDDSRAEVAEALERFHDDAGFGRHLRRLVVALSGPGSGLGMGGVQHLTFRSRPQDEGGGFAEDRLYRGLHPMMGKRLQLWRLSDFDVERLEAPEEDVYLFRGRARANAKDERLFAFAEVRDLTPLQDEDGEILRLPHLEHMVMAALGGIRRFQSQRGPRERLHWNRVFLFVWPDFDFGDSIVEALARRLAPEAEGLGLEKIVLSTHRASAVGSVAGKVFELTDLDGELPTVAVGTPSADPIHGLDAYEQNVLRLRRRGLVHPYELARRLAPDASTRSDLPPGDFVEYDLDASNELVPVDRPPGRNQANIVVGVISNRTRKYPEGMQRVILIGDPSRGMGSLAEPECRRIIAGLEMAHSRRLPLEWFAVSAGAKIAMDSGTENMDWISRVLRSLVVLTQQGLEVNIIVTGINVGAQPYWTAEATMLMHTRGILIETAQGAMVLTGKQALDYSGGVSAEDNFGIGGYERIMGPNGQAQYFARDAFEACRILLKHYEHTYVVPGERFPRRARTLDEPERDVRPSLHGDFGLATVGDVFSPLTNPGRKNPFSIRRIMRAVMDSDHEPLERWRDMQGAEIAVVWDAHLGGYPVCLLGLESHPVPRLGFVPADGPERWTGGTLFPLSSKKVARTLNSASGNRPVVILANLSGFDGSPESMRELQLEFGAEIGRAVVNFDGPIVFLVVSRYHGGAFVVFSAALSEDLEVAALEHTHASVIGGAPAAAVVFARDVLKRTKGDSRVRELEDKVAAAKGAEKVRLQAEVREVTAAVHSEYLGRVADE
ncbi:MAG: hypothetical protein MI919_13255, partial [Holophagales bacterium]|nr:hypothetical protein [Holophagales bacterium]